MLIHQTNKCYKWNCDPLALDANGRRTGEAGVPSSLFHLPADFFHPAAAARSERHGDGVRPRDRGTTTLASPASWASLRSPGANSKPLSSQVQRSDEFIFLCLDIWVLCGASVNQSRLYVSKSRRMHVWQRNILSFMFTHSMKPPTTKIHTHFMVFIIAVITNNVFTTRVHDFTRNQNAMWLDVKQNSLMGFVRHTLKCFFFFFNVTYHPLFVKTPSDLVIISLNLHSKTNSSPL